MPTIQNLTIAVLTYKRPRAVSACLSSFEKQNYLPSQILLIDNDPLGSARDVAKQYSSNLPLRYLHQPIKSIPSCRNLAIEECKTSFIAFIDDDCRLNPDWSEQAHLLLLSNPRSAFIQGGLEKPESATPLVNAQDQRYRGWIESNLTACGYNPEGLDTKNLILNLDLLKSHSIRFDTSLPIFEDVDLGKQIEESRLTGIYCGSLKVSHPYPTHLLPLLKKTYYQGKIRYLFERKWKLPPRASSLKDLRLYRYPISTLLSRINYLLKGLLQIFKIAIKDGMVLRLLYLRLIDLVFDQGYLDAHFKKFILPPSVFIINRYDQAANEERARRVHQFLSDRNINTSIVDSQIIFNNYVSWKKALLISPLIFLLYKLTHLPLRYINCLIFTSLSYFFEMILRGKFISHHFRHNSTSIILCQYSEDMFCALYLPPDRVLLDLPTIYSYELRLSKKYSPFILWLIEFWEQRSYLRASGVCFHWYSLRDLATARKKRFRKLFTLNWGCSPVATTAHFKNTPSCVYIGNVNNEWINPPLLNELSITSSIDIDIYSYEKPNPKFYSNIRYKGYLPDLDQLCQYQFGLITISNDDLRNHGFSAKYLTYLSYGLPVLCPEWRRDPVLEPASIYYNEHNFKQQLKKYMVKKNWIRLHKRALTLSAKLNWNNTLLPLLEEQLYFLIK